MSDEQVLVVPRERVPEQADWYGLRTDGLDGLRSTVVARDGRYEPRDAMERDPTYKQVIPYLVLRDGDRYFLMRRTRAGARRAAARPLVDRRRRAPQPGRRRPAGRAAPRVARGARWPTSSPTSSRVGPAQRRHDRRRRRPPGRRLRRRRGGPAGGRPRDRQADRARSRRPAEVAAVADDLETWSRLVFEALEAAAIR